MKPKLHLPAFFTCAPLFLTPAFAVDRYWDQNAGTSGMGGTGNWNTSSSFWRTGTGAATNGGTLGSWVNYVDDNATNAILSGTDGTLTTTAAIVTNKVTVNSGAFIISNGTGGSFSFNGNDRAISVASGASLRLNPQISGGITLAISGGGTTTFAASNRAYGGSLSVTGSGTEVIISGTNGLDNGASSSHSFGSGTTLQLAASTNYRSTLTLTGATLELNNSQGFITQSGFNLTVTTTKSSVTSLLSNTGTATANYGAIGGNTGTSGIFTVNSTGHISGVDLEYSAGWRNGQMGKAGAGTLRLNAGFIMNHASDYTTFNNAGTALNITAGTFLNEGLVKSVTNVNGSTSVLKTGASSGTFDQVNVTSGVFEVSRSSDLFTTGLTFASGNNPLNLRGGTLRFVGVNTDYSSRMGTLAGTSLVDTNGQDVTFASDLTGTGSISKTGQGTLTLSGDNSFGSGTLTFGSGTANRGYIRLASNNALGNIATIALAASGTGISGLQLEGGITVNQNLETVGRNNADTSGYTLRNISGNNTWDGAITITDGGGSYGIISDSGTLTLGGAIESTYVSTFGARGVIFSGAGSFNVTGDLLGGGPNSQNLNVTKSGGGTLTIAGANNTYTGTTTVTGGSMLVNAALDDTAVNVGANGTIGGTGSLGGTLTFAGGAKLDLTGASIGLNSTDILSVASGKTITLNDFAFSNIIGWDWANEAEGIYTLINGGGTVTLGGTTPTVSNPFAFGNGKSGYFREGSLQVVVIPEPSAAALGGLGLLALLRRRR